MVATLLATLCLLIGASDDVPVDPEEGSPLAPSEELALFQLADPDRVIELVAAEPDVASPVAVAWDEQGRMFVAEMIDYPVGPPGGRVRMLEGPRGDGTFERVTIFAEGLPFPNGVLPAWGGLLVTAAPDVWFLQDHDGDGVAESRRVILTGFAEGNQQLRVNGLFLGLDGRIYGANGRSSGELRLPGDAPGQGVSIQGHDFRFRFDGKSVTELEAIAGFSQFGLARDDWGNRFPSWNTTPWRHVVLEEKVMAREPGLVGISGVAEVIPTGDVALFPISQAPTTFNRESVRSFNASCGPLLWRGGRSSGANPGEAYVCEPLLNLVHRRALEQSGSTFVARRVDEGGEFLSSSDPWFHPVFLAEGLDGSLVVCDFYRRWVEHPDFVPVDQRAAVDWRTGSERGRIWQIRAEGLEPRALPPLASIQDLTDSLGSEISWIRDTARRLLIERHAGDHEVVEALARVAETPGEVRTRSLALWTLASMAANPDPRLPALLEKLMADPDWRLRNQALRVAIERGQPALSFDRLRELAGDEDGSVRLGVVLALGDASDEVSVSRRARILQDDAENSFTRAAILSGVRASAPSLLESLRNQDASWFIHPSPGQTVVLAQLGRMTLESADPGAIARLAGLLDHAGEAAIGGRVAVLAGWSRTPLPLPRELDSRWEAVESISHDEAAPPHLRALAVTILGRSRPDAARARLAEWLDPTSPDLVQEAAIEVLVGLRAPDLLESTLDGWAMLPLSTRARLLAALGRTPELTSALLDAIDRGVIGAHELDPAQRAALTQSRDPAIRERVKELLGATEGDRPAVVARYREALVNAPAGNAAMGEPLFTKHCASCHRMGAAGTALGPDLTSVAGRPLEALIDDVMNPSREVSPDFRNFVAFTSDGRMTTGLLAADRPTGLVLRGPSGVEVTLPRGDVEELKMTEKSLMPEGFEQQITPADLADLIAFLRRAPTNPTP